MFDPDKWVMGNFAEAIVLQVGEIATATMVIPLRIAVALTSAVVHNQDSVTMAFELRWKPDTISGEARFGTASLVGAQTRMLMPEKPNNDASSKFLGPWLLTGPGTLVLVQTTLAVTPNAVVEMNLHWLQAKFAAKSSGLLVPIGAAT